MGSKMGIIPAIFSPPLEASDEEGHAEGVCSQSVKPYSRSPKVGNPIASIPKSNVQGIPALFGLNPVSNFMRFTVNATVF